MSTQAKSEKPHIVLWYAGTVLHWRVSDGRTGSDPKPAGVPRSAFVAFRAIEIMGCGPNTTTVANCPFTYEVI